MRVFLALLCMAAVGADRQPRPLHAVAEDSGWKLGRHSVEAAAAAKVWETLSGGGRPLGLPVMSASVQGQPPHDIDTIRHGKDAGKGYRVGSPLFKLQQKHGIKRPTYVHDGVKPQGWSAAAPGADVVVSAWPGDQVGVDQVARARPQDLLAKNIWAVVINAILQSIVVVVVAWLYLRLREPKQAMALEPRPNSWAYGLFSCLTDLNQDCDICVMATLCPAIRWADTISNTKVGALRFWSALAIMVVLVTLLGAVSSGISLVVALAVAVHYRQKIRRSFGHDTGGSTYVYDCCSYFCCTCCTLMQDAREVEKVRCAALPPYY